LWGVKSELAAAQRQYDEAMAAYCELLGIEPGAPATRAEAKPPSPAPANGNHRRADSLRNRVLMYLEDRRGVAVQVYEIEAAIHAQNEHRKLIWTLANMKRDGLIKHEGRGRWSLEKEDPRKEEDDIQF
jgi:hypothetical protein